jgi:hypothetical protein
VQLPGTNDQSTSTTPIDPDIVAATSLHQRKTSAGGRLGRNSSVRLIARSVTERTNSIREKSKSAVKILGSMLPNRPLMFTDVKPKATNAPVNNSSDVGPASPPDLPSPTSPSRSTPQKKSYQQWLHSDPHGDTTASNIEDKALPPLSSSSSSTTSSSPKHYQQTRRSWRQLSLIRQGSPHPDQSSPLTGSASANELAIASSLSSSSSPLPTNRFSESDKGKKLNHMHTQTVI